MAEPSNSLIPQKDIQDKIIENSSQTSQILTQESLQENTQENIQESLQENIQESLQESFQEKSQSTTVPDNHKPEPINSSEISAIRVSLTNNSNPSIYSQPTIYIPSGRNSEQVIESCNDYIASEIALPGNWSPQLFYTDLKKYPVRSKTLLAENLAERVRTPNPSYLRFFERTRGSSHPSLTQSQNPEVNKQVQRLFDIFTNGSVMLYFENFFLKILEFDQPVNQIDEIILLYIQVLATSPISQWNEIVRKIGSCRFEYFAKEPELYVRMLFSRIPGSTNELQTDPYNMTDFDLLAGMDAASSPTQSFFRAPIDGSRSTLVKNYISRKSGKN